MATKGLSFPVETQRGKIHAPIEWSKTVNYLVNYIKQEVPPDKNFIVMPEGMLINFLTNRESPSWFHAYTPQFVEKFEDRIIIDLQHNRPDYIFITNQETDEYSLNFFCRDYAFNICKYVGKNYKYKGRLETPGQEDDFLWVDVYKKL